MIASTHEGGLHADEIFSLAVLNLFYNKIQVDNSENGAYLFNVLSCC
jgi:hypothetical protein